MELTVHAYRLCSMSPKQWRISARRATTSCDSMSETGRHVTVSCTLIGLMIGHPLPMCIRIIAHGTEFENHSSRPMNERFTIVTPIDSTLRNQRPDAILRPWRTISIHRHLEVPYTKALMISSNAACGGRIRSAGNKASGSSMRLHWSEKERRDWSI